MNPATDETIREYFTVLNRDFSDEEKVKFEYVANEEFKNSILIPTLTSSSADADTSELFLRSAKMLDIFGLLKFDDTSSFTSGGYAVAPVDASTETPAATAIPPKPIFAGNTTIEFVPPSEGQFRRLLLQKKIAKRTWVYQDGRSRTELWDAHNFTESSNLRGNIRSTNHWRNRKETGLVKVILEIV